MSAAPTRQSHPKRKYTPAPGVDSHYAGANLYSDSDTAASFDAAAVSVTTNCMRGTSYTPCHLEKFYLVRQSLLSYKLVVAMRHHSEDRPDDKPLPPAVLLVPVPGPAPSPSITVDRFWQVPTPPPSPPPFQSSPNDDWRPIGADEADGWRPIEAAPPLPRQCHMLADNRNAVQRPMPQNSIRETDPADHVMASSIVRRVSLVQSTQSQPILTRTANGTASTSTDDIDAVVPRRYKGSFREPAVHDPAQTDDHWRNGYWYAPTRHGTASIRQFSNAPSYAVLWGGFRPHESHCGNINIGRPQCVADRQDGVAHFDSMHYSGTYPGYPVPHTLGQDNGPASTLNDFGCRVSTEDVYASNAATGSMHDSQSMQHDHDRVALSQPIRHEATTKTISVLPAPLSHAMDDTGLMNPHQVWLRRHIEAFCATLDDLHELYTRGRHHRAIQINQVGIRCRHCAHLPLALRGPGAVYFPHHTDGLYQAAQNISAMHLASSTSAPCPGMTFELQQALVDVLRTKNIKSRVGRKYWSQLGQQQLGLINTEDGIFCVYTDRTVNNPISDGDHSGG
jgi:hypothetical protein